jgi:hypothetical protein
MPLKIWASLTAIVIGCSSPSPATKGRVVVALTIDWEGAYLAPDGLDALEQLRRRVGDAPMTHFVSAAYFTKEPRDATTAATISRAVRKGDELALHLHAWKSLAVAGGVPPKLAPSYLTGTDKLLEFEDGDVGFDTDLDAYSVPELRVLLRTSRLLLEPTQIRVSRSFRAGAYLGTPKVLQAIREEGFTVDSSATDARQLEEPTGEALPCRVKAIWPAVDSTTQPWLVRAPGGGSSGTAGSTELLEMPVAALADHASTEDMVAIVEAAYARLQKDPGRDVFVVLELELEIAHDYAGRIADAVDKLRAHRELADRLVFATIASAAERARAMMAAGAK